MKHPNRVKVAMERRGTQPGWLQKRASISASTLSRIVKGTCAPSVEVALKLARALGTTVEELWNVEEGNDA